MITIIIAINYYSYGMVVNITITNNNNIIVIITTITNSIIIYDDYDDYYDYHYYYYYYHYHCCCHCCFRGPGPGPRSSLLPPNNFFVSSEFLTCMCGLYYHFNNLRFRSSLTKAMIVPFPCQVLFFVSSEFLKCRSLK